jgi:hypothetical protein
MMNNYTVFAKSTNGIYIENSNVLLYVALNHSPEYINMIFPNVPFVKNYEEADYLLDWRNESDLSAFENQSTEM